MFDNSLGVNHAHDCCIVVCITRDNFHHVTFIILKIKRKQSIFLYFALCLYAPRFLKTSFKVKINWDS